jgi:hypothetical protein
VQQRSRLTTERPSAMGIGDGIMSEEKRLTTDALFEFEGAFAFDDSKMGTH